MAKLRAVVSFAVLLCVFAPFASLRETGFVRVAKLERNLIPLLKWKTAVPNWVDWNANRT